jgi:hypothetical protein
MPSGGYVFHEAGTASNGHAAWVVKKDDGAIWATDVDPSTSPTTGGLVFPLNAKARTDADVGADVSETAVSNMFPAASVGAVSGC